MGRSDDWGTDNEHDAGRFERFHSGRAVTPPDRPSKAEADRDEAELHPGKRD